MLDIRIHKNILVQILKEIYSQTALGPLLGFKGGTAAHFFYELPRFSVDLDFDLLEESRGGFVFQSMEEILQDFGTIREKAKKKNTLFFILSYSREAQNIKVEISKRNFGSRYEIRNYLGIPMLIMKREDVFSRKLVAMLERKKPANRDLFDVWFFLKNNWDINVEMVEKRTKRPLKSHLESCIKFLESISEKHILAGMGEILDEKTKVWAKKNLKSDLLFLLRLKLEQW